VVDQHKVMKKLTLSATEFRSGCHRLLNDVAKGAYSIVITKRGKPVAHQPNYVQAWNRGWMVKR
jgi:hypothetical protein